MAESGVSSNGEPNEWFELESQCCGVGESTENEPMAFDPKSNDWTGKVGDTEQSSCKQWIKRELNRHNQHRIWACSKMR